MKLLHLALAALVLTLSPAWAKAATVSHHPGNTPSVNLALEPASFLLVGLGLAGGGVLRRKRILAGLSMLSPEVCSPELAAGSDPDLAAAFPAVCDASSGRCSRARFGNATRLLAALVGAIVLLSASHALADTISLSTTSVSTINLSPSDDTFSMNAGASTVNTSSGPFTLQTGNFWVGYSPIPDQNLPFTFQDTITLNGITQTVTFAAQDNVTSPADYLTIFGGTPIVFGNEVLTVQSFEISGPTGDNLPVDLQATVAPTPEPGSLLLLGTGLFCLTILYARKRHSDRGLHVADVA